MHLILLLAIVASFITACKEDDPAPSVVGFWSGTYDGSASWHMLYRSNGTVRVFDGADTATAGKAEGTYTVSDSVRTTYTYIGGGPTYSTAGKMNDAATTMVGTYGAGTVTNGGGIFALSR